MSTVVVKRNERKTLDQKELEKKRASSEGGSCSRSLTRGNLRTKVSVTAPFQKKHGIEKCDHVVIKFNPKTFVMSLAFHKKEIEGVSRKINRNREWGTAYIQIDSTLNAFDLELVRNLYRAEFAVNAKNGDILIDFSTIKGEDPFLAPKKVIVARRRVREGNSFVPFNEKEAKKAEREKLALVERAAEEGMLLRKA